MCSYSNTSVSYIFNKNVFKDTDRIKTSRLGFNIAFGVVDGGAFKNLEGIEKAGHFEVSSGEYDAPNYKEELLPFHKCTEEDKKKFYKPNKIFAKNFDSMFTEMFCITNPEKLVFKGDYDGDVCASLLITFKDCDSETSESCFSKK